MQIEVVNVSVEDKGKYNMAVVAYRENGQLKEKKIMSFGAASAVYKVLSKASQGQKFDVKATKNDKGYWDWTEITESNGESSKGGSTLGNPAPKSNYETAEERAMRQVLIVRQSSVSNAIEYLKANPKKVPTVQEVLMVAKQFEDYVFGKNQQEAAASSSLSEMKDDLPI